MATSPNGSLIEPDSKFKVWISCAGGLFENYFVKTAQAVWELVARRRPELRATLEPGSARDFPGPSECLAPIPHEPF